MLNRDGASTIPRGNPFFGFFYLLRSLFSSIYNLLLNSKIWIILPNVLSCVVYLYHKSMVHCVVRSRQVDKSGSRDPFFLVAIFSVLDKIQQFTCT